MDYASGDGAVAKQGDFEDAVDYLSASEFGEVFDRYETPKRRIFWCECYADDETHAIKIANERRAMFKAKGENDGRDV